MPEQLIYADKLNDANYNDWLTNKDFIHVSIFEYITLTAAVTTCIPCLLRV